MIFLGLDLKNAPPISDPASNLLAGGIYEPGKLVFVPQRWFRTPDLNTKDLFPETWRLI